MKIGVFGGTFNPIHKSHIYLAERFMAKLDLDLVLLIPTYTPPHKDPKNLAESEDRYNMCKLAIEGLSGFAVEDFEIRQKTTSYTYKTLEYLTEKYPGSELYLLMGSDMYLTLEQWKNPDIIYRLATLCAVAREEDEYKKLYNYKQVLDRKCAKSVILRILPKPMSSTEIRQLAAESQPLDAYLPDNVAEYIKEHELYSKKEGIDIV